MADKFEFPHRGFRTVQDKVKESDFFLDKFKESIASFSIIDANYYFSAFVSAARSITFALQACMSKYPGFGEWYPERQKRLAESLLAKLFVKIRNHSQKVGNIPLSYSGFSSGGKRECLARFYPTEDFPSLPEGDVVSVATNYLIVVLEIIHEFYSDFAPYVNPDVVFTKEGLNKLGWTIDDLEESLGLPRGWTGIPDWGDDKDDVRLHLLRREAALEEMSHYFEKYGILADAKE